MIYCKTNPKVGLCHKILNNETLHFLSEHLQSLLCLIIFLMLAISSPYFLYSALFQVNNTFLREILFCLLIPSLLLSQTLFWFTSSLPFTSSPVLPSALSSSAPSLPIISSLLLCFHVLPSSLLHFSLPSLFLDLLSSPIPSHLFSPLHVLKD